MISSASNPRVKHVASLIKSSSDRRKEGMFVIEGLRICQEAPKDYIEEAYISESLLNKYNNDAVAADSDEFVFNGVSYEVVSDAVFKKMSDTVTTQGALCVMRQIKHNLDTIIKRGTLAGDESVKLLLLENIQDPGNLGTMIRTAEAAGFDAIVTDGKTVDLYNPKVIRSTMGGIFRVPVIRQEDFSVCLRDLKEAGFTLYAALLDGASDYRRTVYDKKIGIMIGNEGNGLTEETASLSDVHVKIPMCGKVESLNASVAASLLMYEATR